MPVERGGEDRLAPGRIRKGYLADLLLVDGDPLADLRVLEDRAGMPPGHHQIATSSMSP